MFQDLFQGKAADGRTPGVFIWRLRPELQEALHEFDIMNYEYETPGVSHVPEEQNFWWMNADPAIWSFSAAPIGERRRIYQNSLDAKPGDMVIGYETSPVKQIVALAKITQVQDGERVSLFFEKTEDLGQTEYLRMYTYRYHGGGTPCGGKCRQTGRRRRGRPY